MRTACLRNSIRGICAAAALSRAALASTPDLVAPLAEPPRESSETYVLSGEAGATQWTERLYAGRDDTVPGTVLALPPTLNNLAVEWLIEGDDNLNGNVAVRYRKAGARDWREGMPLRRVPAQVWRDASPNNCYFPWQNKHAGSVFDLDADSEYEIRLSLSDPDGGAAEHTVRARTRPEPRAAADARIVRATPADFAEIASRAEAGDLILLGPGNYGFFAATRDGKPGRPIVFRADDRATFEGGALPANRGGNRGDSLFEGISLQDRKWVYLEGLVSDGTVDLFNAEHCAVRYCRIYGAFGVTSAWSYNLALKWAPRVGARYKHPPANANLYVHRDKPAAATPSHAVNCYIADNEVYGMTPWSRDAWGASGANIGEGIEIAGPGNVICHNIVEGFRDCISLMEGRFAIDQNCIDIHNNDIRRGADDGIEADYSMSNCRYMRNRLTNVMRGIAIAPSLGGPSYVIRNALYNTRIVWQLGRSGSGYVVLHNTSVKSGSAARIEPSSFCYSRNNLFFGADPRGLIDYVSSWAGYDFDFNGYGAFGGVFSGRLDGAALDSIETYRKRGFEPHAVALGADTFAAPVSEPTPIEDEYAPPDLRLGKGSAAIDAGQPLANINDGFAGAAPDLGAFEFGDAPPLYGPRPKYYAGR